MKLACFFLINSIDTAYAFSAYADKAGSGDTINDLRLMKESSMVNPLATTTLPFQRTRKPSKVASEKPPKMYWENTWVCGDGKVIPITKIIGKKKKSVMVLK